MSRSGTARKSISSRRPALQVVAAPPLRLDLGCGQRKQDGFTGVDIAAAPGVDVVHDLCVAPWPWPDESVAETRSSHFLEHVPGPQRATIMNELWRVLQWGGKAIFVVPYWASMRAVQDYTHAWPPLCEASFLYFNRQWRVENGLDHYGLVCDFDFAYGYSIEGAWASRAQEARDFALRHYLHVASDLHVTLMKNARQGGS